jgi:mannosyltransferase
VLAPRRAEFGRHHAEPRRPRWVVPAGLTALSLVLGLVTLGRQSLWDDEAFSAAAARLSWGELWALSSTRDPHMLAYHGFLKLWAALGGTSEWWLRLPSVLAGAAAVAVLWAAVVRLAGRRVAGIAAGLLAVSTSLVQYQQEARPYAFAVLGVCVAVLLLVRAVQGGGQGRWLGYGAVAGLTTYTHPMAVVAAGGVAPAVLALSRVPWRGVLTGLAVAAVVAAPQAALMLTTPTPSIWSWVPATDAYHLAGAAYLMSGHSGPIGLVVVAVLVAVFIVLVLRRRPDLADLLALLWAGALPVAVVAGSLLRPLLVSRYLLPALPGVLLCCALMLVRFGRPVLTSAVVAVLVGTSLWSSCGWYTGNDKDDWRTAVATVAAQARPGDGIILTRDHREPFGYYQRQTANPDALEPVSPARPWHSPIPAVEDHAAERDPSAAIASHTRLWVVYIDPEGLPEHLSRALASAYGEPHREQVTRVTLLLYAR